MDAKEETTGKEITCTAAVAWGPWEPLSIEQIRIQPPHKLEVRIKILFTSICHADLSAWQGQTTIDDNPSKTMTSAGKGNWTLLYMIVESVGEGVEEMVKGDHVLAIFNGECGECTHCKSKTTNLCTKF
ncbi:hypothetical protein R6Q57_016668 [Mikania cordata]